MFLYCVEISSQVGTPYTASSCPFLSIKRPLTLLDLCDHSQLHIQPRLHRGSLHLSQKEPQWALLPIERSPCCHASSQHSQDSSISELIFKVLILVMVTLCLFRTHKQMSSPLAWAQYRYMPVEDARKGDDEIMSTSSRSTEST